MRTPKIPDIAPPPLPASSPSIRQNPAASVNPYATSLLTAPIVPSATTQRRTLLGGA